MYYTSVFVKTSPLSSSFVCAVSVARAALNRIFGLKVHSLCVVAVVAALQQQQQQQQRQQQQHKSRPGPKDPHSHIHIHRLWLSKISEQNSWLPAPANSLQMTRLGPPVLEWPDSLWSAHVHSSNNLVKLTRSTERVLPSGSSQSRVWLQSGVHPPSYSIVHSGQIKYSQQQHKIYNKKQVNKCCRNADVDAAHSVGRNLFSFPMRLRVSNLKSRAPGLRSPVSKRRQSRLTTINLHSLLETPKSVKVSLRARFSGESRILSHLDSDSMPANPHVTQYQG